MVFLDKWLLNSTRYESGFVNDLKSCCTAFFSNFGFLNSVGTSIPCSAGSHVPSSVSLVVLNCLFVVRIMYVLKHWHRHVGIHTCPGSRVVLTMEVKTSSNKGSTDRGKAAFEQICKQPEPFLPDSRLNMSVSASE